MTDLQEAGTVTKTGGGKMQLRIITPGKGSSGLYPQETIEAAGRDKVFPAGTHMHVNHQTSEEGWARPEGDLTTLAGVLTEDAYWDGEGLTASAKIFEHWRPILEDMKDDIGVSIRASGEVSKASGTKTITRLVEAQSVDFVTKAGRGGRIMSMLESAKPNDVLHELTEAYIKPSLEDRKQQVEAKLSNATSKLCTTSSAKDFGALKTSSTTEEIVAETTGTPPEPHRKEAVMADTKVPAQEAGDLAAENARLKEQITALQAQIAKLKGGAKEAAAKAIYGKAFAEAGVNGDKLIPMLVESAAAGDDDLDEAALTATAKSVAESLIPAGSDVTGMGETAPVNEAAKHTTADLLSALEG